MQKEMQHHHGMETYTPVDPSKLTYDDKREAVESLCNIFKKHCGRVKARQCGRGGYAEEIFDIHERRRIRLYRAQ